MAPKGRTDADALPQVWFSILEPRPKKWKQMNRLLLLALLFSVGCGGGTSSSPAPVAPPAAKPIVPAKHYIVTDLAPLPGAGAAQANAISRGHAVGYSVLSDGSPRVTFWHDGSVEDLGPGIANAINGSDQIAGYILQSTAHATLWNHGVITDLGTLPGFDSTVATGINDSGTVVGIAYEAANPNLETGFRWTQAGMQAITGSETASGVNRGGDVAGLGTNLHAAIFGKKTTDLGTLGGFSIATGINAKDHACGYSPVSSGPVHGFFYSATMTDLGTLAAGDTVVATGLNDFDLVVGTEVTPIPGAVAHVRTMELERVLAHVQGTSVPFVWSATSGIENLNSLITSADWTLSIASGIDSSGKIVGAGVIAGQVHGFLLTPGGGL